MLIVYFSGERGSRRKAKRWRERDVIAYSFMLQSRSRLLLHFHRLLLLLLNMWTSPAGDQQWHGRFICITALHKLNKRRTPIQSIDKSIWIALAEVYLRLLLLLVALLLEAVSACFFTRGGSEVDHFYSIENHLRFILLVVLQLLLSIAELLQQ